MVGIGDTRLVRATMASIRSLLLLGCLCGRLTGADLPATDELLLRGQYAECIRQSATAIDDGVWNEHWRHIKIQAELASGRYADALQTLEPALARYPSSVELRRLGRDVYLLNGRAEKAAELLKSADTLIQRYGAWRYTDARSLVAWGRLMILRGADPKQVLDQFFNRAKKEHREYIDAYVAAAELALAKHDYALAAETLDQAHKINEQHPEVNYLLARAFAPSDQERTNAALNAALEFNPRHTGCLLMMADSLVNSEQYAQAQQVLAQVLAVNPSDWRARSYLAVLAHLASDRDRETYWHDLALSTWQENPGVDHLIGRKLSQQYRFAEGAAYQRQALRIDPDFLPAKTQLAQDLLRLGREEEGWRLAEDVNKRDQYDVVAHNLLTLHDNLSRFRTLEGDGFVVRMDTREADIYGRQVMEHLRRAKKVLCAKYEVDLQEPVHVEIFPQQADFAIRTFGLPGGAGFLGVCFGNVITANSPASQGKDPSNWRSVLWHEFCHVVTLNKTRNRMPRWLSEGISVYEERERDAAWGQAMSASYRNLILKGEATPVSQLSSAFLSPSSPLHLEFAYFQASLVVRYLVEEYGLDTVKRILQDLAAGMPINESLQRYTGSLELLDKEFQAYLEKQAAEFAADADWSQVELPGEGSNEDGQSIGLDALRTACEKHPNNLTLLTLYAQALIKAGQYAKAQQPLKKLLEIYPEDISANNAYQMLAAVYRKTLQLGPERDVLEHLVARDADAVDALLRLLEICRQQKDWTALAKYAQRLLDVNPLLVEPHRQLAHAARQLNDPVLAAQAYGSLVHMDPVDPAEMHLRLGQALLATGELRGAKRHVVQALEEAPRFREAHRTLLEIVDRKDAGPTAADGDSKEARDGPRRDSSDDKLRGQEQTSDQPAKPGSHQPGTKNGK